MSCHYDVLHNNVEPTLLKKIWQLYFGLRPAVWCPRNGQAVIGIVSKINIRYQSNLGKIRTRSANSFNCPYKVDEPSAREVIDKSPALTYRVRSQRTPLRTP